MIDEISLRILEILQQKARVPNVEVARQVNMAPSAVLERIRKLEKQGFINGYEVILNPKCFNRDLVAFVHVHLSHASLADQVAEKLELIPEIQEIHFITGMDCFLTKVRVSGTQTLYDTITQKISMIDGATSTETTLVMKTYKETSQIPLDSVSIDEITETPHKK